MDAELGKGDVLAVPPPRSSIARLRPSPRRLRICRLISSRSHCNADPVSSSWMHSGWTCRRRNAVSTISHRLQRSKLQAETWTPTDKGSDPLWLLAVPLYALPVALGNRSARRPRCLQFGVNWFQSDEFHSSWLCQFQFHSRSRLQLCRRYPKIASGRSAHGSRSRARGPRVSFKHAVRVAVRDLSSHHAPPRPAGRSPQERNQGYGVLFGPEEGRRPLDPTDEDLSAGAPALVVQVNLAVVLSG